MGPSILHRILGGSPAGLVVKLVVVSLIVGAGLSWIGIEPMGLLFWIERSVLHLWDSGLDALEEVGRDIALGAIVVVPAFVLLRLLGAGRRAPPPAQTMAWRGEPIEPRDFTTSRD